VYSEATTGSKILTVGTGFAGAMSAVKALAPATVDTRVIEQANTALNTSNQCYAGGAKGVNLHTVTIPAGTVAARFSLYDADTTGAESGLSDLDLVVITGTSVVGSSGGATANEAVVLNAPAPGEYKVCVIGYEPAGGSATYALSSWILQPSSTAGNFKVNLPSSATIGGTASVGMSWSALPVGKRYFGVVNFLLGGVKQGTTQVEIDTTDPLPLFQNSRNKETLAF
jgi:hypothetical protein